MRKLSYLITFTVLLCQMSRAHEVPRVEQLKTEIIELAESYKGQGDPDLIKQNLLLLKVGQLLEIAPQKPALEKLAEIEGPWELIWGPYNYDDNSRVVKPSDNTAEIYQVVSKDGYYWNVSPSSNPNFEITLLRGSFTIDPARPNDLNAQFTRFVGLRSRPDNFNIWDLAPFAEIDTRFSFETVIPDPVVPSIFGSGVLTELYSDNEIRISLGKGDRGLTLQSLFVRRRPN